MKQILAFILACVTLLSLIGCSIDMSEFKEKMNEPVFDIYERFEKVYSQDRRHIIVDTETGVMYLMWQYNSGAGITVMVDETGAPLLWSDHVKGEE